MKPLFRGQIKDGDFDLYPYEGERCKKYIESLKDGIYQISIERLKKPRSTNQNSYYWGVVIAILSDYFGYTPQETHDALKWQFLRIEGLRKNDQIDTVGSTTDLSTKQFEAYCENIRRWAATEFSVDIPEPNEAA